MKKFITTLFLVMISLPAFCQLTTLVSSTLKDGEFEKRFFLFGNTSLNSSGELRESLVATQQFSGILNAREHNSDAWIIPGVQLYLGVNAAHLKPNGLKRDSLDFISLMFPQTGNSGFMFAPRAYWQIAGDDAEDVRHFASIEPSVALRQAKVVEFPILDTLGENVGNENLSFSVLNWNLTFRYELKYEAEEDFYVAFGLAPYVNLFNIPDEDARTFNKLAAPDSVLTSPNKEEILSETSYFFNSVDKSRIGSVGLKITLNINGFNVFVDLRENRSTRLTADNNPYKGFVYNAGFSTDLAIFSR